jgi:ferredoxin-thioredoxin reductase catalytic subunit
MEGIKDFLKNLWAKIKAFVMKIWGKLKEFWDKHFSTVGRLVKKLEALGEKIADSSGTRKDTGGKDIKAPSDIARAFKTTSTLSIADVKEYVKEAGEFVLKVKTYSLSSVTKTLEVIRAKNPDSENEFNKYANVSENEIEEKIREIETKYEQGNPDEEVNHIVMAGFIENNNYKGEEAVLLSKIVGGKKLVAEVNDKRISLTLQPGDDSYDSSVDMVIASKKDLADLNRDMTKMLNNYLYLKDNVNKVNDAVNKFIKETDKNINSKLDEKFKDKPELNKLRTVIQKYASKAMYKFSSISAFYANLFKMTKTITISTIQATVRYISFTLKQYKAAE